MTSVVSSAFRSLHSKYPCRLGLCYKHRRWLSSSYGTDEAPVFKPKRVALLSRITRYEFEKKRYRGKSEEELKEALEQKHSDYNTLLERHKTHYRCLDFMIENLKKHGIETRVLNRVTFNKEALDWADAIFTAGGDGTFLGAASKIEISDKPVIGINTDPSRSEGCLCLPKEKYSASNFVEILDKLLDGDFKWKWKQRIRITMSGIHENDEPIELHDQQLQHLEHRYTEHVLEGEMCFLHRQVAGNETNQRVLPIRALNEVFIGESLSSRVSYYELSIDDLPGSKQKSSGVTICTGTGSSSWYFHINALAKEAVKDVLSIANRLGNGKFATSDDKFLESVMSKFNNSLMFDPSMKYMGYVVRDPLNNGVFNVPKVRGIAERIKVSSRMWESNLVLDGGSSFKFNDGAIATFEIFDEDALRTVEMD